MPVVDALLYSTDLALHYDSRMSNNALLNDNIHIKIQILGDGYDIYSHNSESLKLEEFLQSINTKDYDEFGVIIKLKSGGSATYLPGVSSDPYFESIQHVFMSLVRKAGGSGQLNEISKIQFYKTICETIKILRK